jgi:hypothetical protein
LWYCDVNFSLGKVIGVTFGFMMSPEGFYPYLGGGFVTSSGFSITWSDSDPITGWNVGFQFSDWGSGQLGYSFGEGGGFFAEAGLGTPGLSLTGFYASGPWNLSYNVNQDVWW